MSDRQEDKRVILPRSTVALRPECAATGLFDAGFILIGWSGEFGGLFDLTARELAAGPHLADILGFGPNDLQGRGGQRRRISCDTRVPFPVLRGREPGRIETTISGVGKVASDIIPQVNGTIASVHYLMTAGGRDSAAEAQRGEGSRQRKLLESAPTGVMISREQDGQILFANTRLGEILGLDDRAQIYTLPGDQAFYTGHRASLVARLRSEKTLRDIETSIDSPSDGETRWLLVWLQAINFEGDSAVLWWCTDISRMKETEAELKRLALYDGLTGLPNRRLFNEHLLMALHTVERYGRTGALLFLDLDGFKAINDNHGHDAGDLVLRETARRLRAAVRDSDEVARLAGDEFMVIVQNLESPAEAATVAERILHRVDAPIDWGGIALMVGFSIGIRLFDGSDRDIEKLIRQADSAMYEAKRAGKATYRFFAGEG